MADAHSVLSWQVLMRMGPLARWCEASCHDEPEAKAVVSSFWNA